MQALTPCCRGPQLEDDISTLALTPDASHLILGISKSYQMHTYALSPDFSTSPIAAAPDRERSVRQTTPIIVSATDPTGTLVATGGADGIVKVWDIRKGFVTHNLRGHGGLVSALSFYMAEGEADVEMDWKRKGNGKKAGRFMLATGGEDTTIRVWDLETTKNVATLRKHESIVRGLDWSPDGRRLLSGGRDGVMCLFDTATWNAVITPTGEEVEAVGFIASGIFVREDGGQVDKLVFAAGRQDRVRIWDLTEGVEITMEAKVEEDEEKGVIQIMSVILVMVILEEAVADGLQIPQGPAVSALYPPGLHSSDSQPPPALATSDIFAHKPAYHHQLRPDPRPSVPPAGLVLDRHRHQLGECEPCLILHLPQCRHPPWSHGNGPHP